MGGFARQGGAVLARGVKAWSPNNDSLRHLCELGAPAVIVFGAHSPSSIHRRAAMATETSQREAETRSPAPYPGNFGIGQPNRIMSTTTTE